MAPPLPATDPLSFITDLLFTTQDLAEAAIEEKQSAHGNLVVAFKPADDLKEEEAPSKVTT